MRNFYLLEINYTIFSTANQQVDPDCRLVDWLDLTLTAFTFSFVVNSLIQNNHTKYVFEKLILIEILYPFINWKTNDEVFQLPAEKIKQNICQSCMSFNYRDLCFE